MLHFAQNTYESFIVGFKKVRPNNFSDDALCVLHDYLLQMGINSIDVIGTCLTYIEEPIEDFLERYETYGLDEDELSDFLIKEGIFVGVTNIGTVITLVK